MRKLSILIMKWNRKYLPKTNFSTIYQEFITSKGLIEVFNLMQLLTTKTMLGKSTRLYGTVNICQNQTIKQFIENFLTPKGLTTAFNLIHLLETKSMQGLRNYGTVRIQQNLKT